MAPCCLDKEEVEVDVPEGDQVPKGTQPVGFTGKPQLIKYLYWDLTDEVSKIVGHEIIWTFVKVHNILQHGYFFVLAKGFFKSFNAK